MGRGIVVVIRILIGVAGGIMFADVCQKLGLNMRWCLQFAIAIFLLIRAVS